MALARTSAICRSWASIVAPNSAPMALSRCKAMTASGDRCDGSGGGAEAAPEPKVGAPEPCLDE